MALPLVLLVVLIGANAGGIEVLCKLRKANADGFGMLRTEAFCCLTSELVFGNFGLSMELCIMIFSLAVADSESKCKFCKSSKAPAELLSAVAVLLLGLTNAIEVLLLLLAIPFTAVSLLMFLGFSLSLAF